MISDTGMTSRGIGHIVERQLRNWEIARSQKLDRPVEPRTQVVEHFVSVSRAVGLPGEQVAERLHERLGWPVFDREILHAMAGDDAHRERIYRVLDKHDENWLDEFVRSFCEDRFISGEDYFHRLTETVAALARAGHAIFLGRGTDLILPREVGLRVRLTAGREFCVGRFAKQNQVAPDVAADQVDEIERERARFLKSHYRADASDPNRHDLIINFETFDLDQTVELIMGALRNRGIVD